MNAKGVPNLHTLHSLRGVTTNDPLASAWPTKSAANVGHEYPADSTG